MTCDDLLCIYFFIPRLKYIKSYIHQIRDYYCACDSDYDDDDDDMIMMMMMIINVIFLSQNLVPLKYFAKLSKQFLFDCLIIKLIFFYQGRGRESCMIFITWRPSPSPSCSIYRVGIQSWKVLEFQGESLKSPWIPFLLEKSLNFCAIPWMSLNFLQLRK